VKCEDVLACVLNSEMTRRDIC